MHIDLKEDPDPEPEPVEIVVEPVVQVNKKARKAKKVEEKRSGRKLSKLSVVIPDSIVSNAQSSELRSYFIS